MVMLLQRIFRAEKYAVAFSLFQSGVVEALA